MRCQAQETCTSKFHIRDEIHQNIPKIVMNKRLAVCVKDFIPIADRVMVVQKKNKRVDINIIQVYSPTLVKVYEEEEDLYYTINELMSKMENMNLLLKSET